MWCCVIYSYIYADTVPIYLYIRLISERAYCFNDGNVRRQNHKSSALSLYVTLMSLTTSSNAFHPGKEASYSPFLSFPMTNRRSAHFQNFVRVYDWGSTANRPSRYIPLWPLTLMMDTNLMSHFTSCVFLCSFTSIRSAARTTTVPATCS